MDDRFLATQQTRGSDGFVIGEDGPERVYDIERAVEDGATVRIYYESRLARIQLDEDERPTIDEEMEEVTEGEEVEQTERLKRKWAAIEKLVGTEKRIEQIAEDIVQHWGKRLESMTGKAMIVCMQANLRRPLCRHYQTAT